MGAFMKKWNLRIVLLFPLILLIGLSACQRETPAEKTQSLQSATAVDRAAQEAVDAMKTPMDKARGVEGTLEKAAEQTADKVQESAQ